MQRDKIWTTAFAAVAVACAGVLFGLSGEKAVGAFFAVLAIACVSYLWWQVYRGPAESAARPRAGTGGGQAIADAIDRVLDGERTDTSGLDRSVAEALDRLSDRLNALSREVAELSPSDELTSLAKEDVFNNVLWREFSRAARYKTAMSLALVEINGYDQIQAKYGKDTCEEITRHVASVILQMVRETDLAARYGEDRFAVIMPETGQPGAGEFAQRLNNALAEGEFRADGGSVKISVTVGIASIPSQDIKTAPDLVEKAATALESRKV